MKCSFKVFMLVILLIPMNAIAAQKSFKEKYNTAAKDMVPILQITTCRTIIAKKLPGKEILECSLNSSNSLLSIDFMNKQLTDIWLMIDSTQLDGPADLMRSGGMLLRAGRGSFYGDYLAVAAKAFEASNRIGWKEACIDDKESDFRFCVSSDDSRIFNLMLTPLKH